MSRRDRESPGPRVKDAPRPGQAITSDFLRSVVRAVRANGVPPPRARAIDEDTGSDQPRSSSTGGGATVSIFLVSTQQNDTITATTGEVIAKPEPLRGFIGSQTVSGELQVIDPPYLVNDQIFAVQVDATDLGMGTVQWVDLNVAPRLLVTDWVP